MTAQQIHEKSIRDGQTQIIRRFGSKVAQVRFGIASDRHVPSPAEKLDSIATAAADRALKKFMAPTAKPSAPSKPTPAAKTSTSKSFAARGENWSVKRFCVPFSR